MAVPLIFAFEDILPKPPDLIASYFTLAGQAVPFESAEKEVSPHSLEARASAAAAAGYSGIGISFPDLAALRKTLSFGEIRGVLDAAGIAHLELECIVDWHSDGARLAASREVQKLLFDCAASIGACHIKVAGDQDGAAVPHDQVVRTFRSLCADAKAAGTRIVIECMPWSNLPTPAEACALVADAGAYNGGVLLDIWHVARAGFDFAAIASLPEGTIGYVELCDALLAHGDDLKADTIDERRLCGEGELDVAAFVSAIRAAGYQGMWGVEVISHEQRRRSSAAAAVLTAVSAREFIGA